MNDTETAMLIDSLRSELRRQSQELQRAREALRNMVAAYDLADEQGMFSDHGENHEAGMSCPGCLCDIASEECREALAALAQPAQKQGEDRG